jgi:hypothetical protein
MGAETGASGEAPGAADLAAAGGEGDGSVDLDSARPWAGSGAGSGRRLTAWGAMANDAGSVTRSESGSGAGVLGSILGRARSAAAVTGRSRAGTRPGAARRGGEASAGAASASLDSADSDPAGIAVAGTASGSRPVTGGRRARASIPATAPVT